jgi:phosphoenolpyruvate-protein kinase (PTS system EI component)
MWLGEADPCETTETARADDPERAKLAALLEHWEAVISDRPVTAKEVIQATMGDQTEAKIALGDALKAVAVSFNKADDKYDAQRLGNYLAKHAGRVIGMLVIVKDKIVRGSQTWRLEYRW